MVKKKSSAIARKTTKTKTAKKAVKKASATQLSSEHSAEPVAAPVEQAIDVEDLSPVKEAAPAAATQVLAQTAKASPAPAQVVTPVAEATTLPIHLTGALLSKLRRSAQEEGVDLNTLVHELLTEGVTLRAWEIIERKNAMRAPSQGNAGYQQPGGQHRNGGHNNRRNNNNNRRGGNGNGNAPTGTAWMDDKAQFLEYVRNQEKRRR